MPKTTKETKPLPATVARKSAALKAARLAAAGKGQPPKAVAPIEADNLPEIKDVVVAAPAAAPARAARAAKPAAVTPERAAELRVELTKERSVLEQARFENQLMVQTGMKPVAIARIIEPGSRAAMGKVWDSVIYRKCALLIEEPYRQALASGSLTLPQVGELYRVPAHARPQLHDFIKTGAKLTKVHDFASELARQPQAQA